MEFITIKEAATNWQLAEQTVRRYCREGRIPNARQEDYIWYIPADAKRPGQIQEKKPIPITPLAKKLQQQKKKKAYHGLYDFVQIQLTYSSSRMASNRLTRKQVDHIFRKGKVQESFEPLKVSDLIEVLNHVACVDYIIDHAMEPLSQKFIKAIHKRLMSGTVDSWNALVDPGIYRPSEFSRKDRMLPPAASITHGLAELIDAYEALENVEINDILDFHVAFERLAPFKDGNGRVGRLLMFKECIRHSLTPFIIDDKHRSNYLEGIKKWSSQRKVLLNVTEAAQKYFQGKMDLCDLDEHRQRFLPDSLNND